jgi:hypothetical protein
MQLFKTKLFETIHAMTMSERDRIPHFILSPAFFTKEGKILELYNLFRGEVEKYEHDEPFIDSEVEIYKLWSPKREWNKFTFDSVESRLLNVIRKAIAYQNSGLDRLKSNLTEEEERNIEIKQLIYLLQFYRERKLHHLFENAINRLNILHNSLPFSNEHYYTTYLTSHEEYSLVNHYRMSNQNDKRFEMLQNLDVYYIVQKLPILLQSEPPIKDAIEPQLEYLEKLNTSQNPVFNRIINLYRMAFALIWHKEGEDENILEQYLEVLEDDAFLLPIEQQKNLYTNARNFCTIKYKNGQLHYLDILFKLIKKNLKTGLLYRNDGIVKNGILHSAVQNTVAIALKLKQAEWALNFLEEHKTKIIAPTLPEQQRFYHFNMACYHFQLKQYEEALFLLQTDFDDKRYLLAARALEIKLYYEKDNKKEKEVDFLGSRIAAFETYLSRNEIPDLDKAGYRNFIKLVKRMNKRKPIRKQDLQEKYSIAEREWILEKAKEVDEYIKLQNRKHR